MIIAIKKGIKRSSGLREKWRFNQIHRHMILNILIRESDL